MYYEIPLNKDSSKFPSRKFDCYVKNRAAKCFLRLTDTCKSAIINGKLGIPFSDSLVSFIVQILFQDVCVFYRWMVFNIRWEIFKSAYALIYNLLEVLKFIKFRKENGGWWDVLSDSSNEMKGCIKFKVNLSILKTEGIGLFLPHVFLIKIEVRNQHANVLMGRR